MANYPDNLQYTKDHEWLRVTGATAEVGITDFAQSALGDVVYVELPVVGDSFDQGKAFGSVESVKSVSELFSPISGEVVAINEALADSPELVNTDPYKGGWMIKLTVENAGQIDALLSASEYEDFVATQSE
ncbi:MAG: glycine cleavage system protein GcvH [Acidobacteria bacterium]|nr:glycine cleavage system protein GcvH [Acidobacteriota bacterium]MBI3425859.1 glycine cleavage system protein GcvH [Acidobacteriota bacterium]